MSRCEFVGRANTKNGKVVPCTREGVWRMRLRTIDAIPMGKPIVCDEHKDLLLSAKVQAAGRDWQIDSHVRDFPPRED